MYSYLISTCIKINKYLFKYTYMLMNMRIYFMHVQMYIRVYTNMVTYSSDVCEYTNFGLGGHLAIRLRKLTSNRNKTSVGN